VSRPGQPDRFDVDPPPSDPADEPAEPELADEEADRLADDQMRGW
jgi:hypothetical protein